MAVATTPRKFTSGHFAFMRAVVQGSICARARTGACGPKASTRIGKAVDLSVEPSDARRSDWTSDDYSACLAVAAEARRREVQWIRYWSARDVAGHCGAVLDPGSLKSIELNKQQTWVCKVSATAALMRHEQDSISCIQVRVIILLSPAS